MRYNSFFAYCSHTNIPSSLETVFDNLLSYKSKAVNFVSSPVLRRNEKNIYEYSKKHWKKLKNIYICFARKQ